MKTNLLILVLLVAASTMATSQIVYEDFEGTPLEWNPFGDGVYNGAIDNPDPNFVNNSGKVGSYTKSDMHAFSLLIAFTPDTMDLTTMNQFSIDVYSPVPSQILFKIEGDGEGMEAVRNIANTNVWQTYTFDFSAAAGFMTANKLIVFFDPGVEMSGDTYLFDNIVANAAGPCAGTVVDMLIVDDFECQRNASYGQGWDILEAVPNPDPSPVNESSTVGQYEDPPGTFTALVVNHNGPIDLSSNNIVNIKLRAPVAGNFLVKLEGGLSAPFEVGNQVTEIGSWQEYSIDFSSQAEANHKSLVLFFNAGVEPGAGEIYHIDDISWSAPPPPEALEDFEDGGKLGWEPLGGDETNHGTFNGIIANADQSGINASPNVGRYTKGDAAFSTVSAFLPNGLDLSAMPQLNLQVNAPEGSTKVTLQLASATQGNKDVSRDIVTTGEWNQLEFNFEEFQDITDFESVNILFDGGVASPGTSYLFDNLLQGSSTVDPCEGTVAIPFLYDDYECQRNVNYGAGADRLTVVNNPFLTAANSSTGVGEYLDPIGPFDALVFDPGASLDLSLNNQFRIKIYSTQVVPLGFKLEGGTSPAVEIVQDVSAVDEWVEYVVDFSDQAEADHARIVVFFNFAVTPAQEDLYWVDDVFWSRAPYTACIADMETPDLSLPDWGSFEAGSGNVNVVPNPSPDALNSSATCLQFVEAADGGQPWAGFFKGLGNYITFSGSKTIRLKVLMPAISDMSFKLEQSQTGAPQTGDVTLVNEKVGEWEELVFDYSFTEDNAQYQQLTVIPNILEIPTKDMVYYMDDISIGDAICNMSVGVGNLPIVESFRVSPNPVSHKLFIENTENIGRIEVYSAAGQKVRTVQLIHAESVGIEVESLSRGLYILAGYNSLGQLVANAKFVKE